MLHVKTNKYKTFVFGAEKCVLLKEKVENWKHVTHLTILC